VGFAFFGDLAGIGFLGSPDPVISRSKCKSPKSIAYQSSSLLLITLLLPKSMKYYWFSEDYAILIAFYTSKLTNLNEYSIKPFYMKNTFLTFTLIIFLALPSLQAQNANIKMVKISGTVTDAQGNPILKGDIFADSLITGVRTNKKGMYKLRTPIDTDIISVYSEQHGLQSEVYKGQEEINLKFTNNNELLKKSDLMKHGYIFDKEVFRSIGRKDYALYQNIYQLIKQEFAGVIVNEVTGTIIVRGYIGGDQTPLFIVDGSYVSNIGSINPIELKSVELLKGADTAIYGARGAPGVFIFTTKK
jgi:hypothetical protein